MDLKERSLDYNRRHPWELARLQVVNQLTLRHIKEFKGKKVLDVGCGDLFFLQQFSLNRKEAEFYAIDTALDNQTIEEGRKTNINAFRTIEDLKEKYNEISFDLIFLMDEVEHIENDHKFLKGLVQSGLVNERTILIITVPAYQTLFSSHDVFLEHYRRYNNTTLNSLTKGVGLDSVEKGYFFTSLLFPRIAQVLVEKFKFHKKTKGTGLTFWKGGVKTTRIFQILLIADFKIHLLLKSIGLKTPGLSNYIVCKRAA